MSVKFQWNAPVAQIAKRVTGGGDAALFAANEARKLMDKFVPMKKGNLKGIVEVYVENGVGIVHYLSPYAHRQYEGDTFNFSTEGNKLATAHWDRAMMQVHGKALINAVQKYLERR